MKQAKLIPTSWSQIKESVKAINPSLYKKIQVVNPSDKLPLYAVSYPFGEKILENGQLYLPNSENEVVHVNDSSIDIEIYNNLKYSREGLPAGIVLENSYELFIHNGKQIFPILIAEPGALISLWRHMEETPFHPTKFFSANSGARTLFMLPNIGDFVSHHNLKRDYKFKHPAPKNLTEHWRVFKSIYDHSDSAWNVKVLFFSQAWIDKILHDESWQSLKLYFLENCWNSCAYERNRVFYDYAFSCVQQNNNLKPNPYLADTLRHLLMIALGHVPGFAAATSTSCGPIDLFQKAYMESYGLTKYAPTIFQPTYFKLSEENPQPVYYSLQLPTTLEFSPKSRQTSNVLLALQELFDIVKIFLSDIRNNKIALNDTILGKVAKEVSFDFFHNKTSETYNDEIFDTSGLPEVDPYLSKILTPKKAQEISTSGSFLRGCVIIKKSTD